MTGSESQLRGRIAELEEALLASSADVRYLEALEQVGRAVRGADDLDSLLASVLDQLLSIFGCDRAWLLYPCDPAAPAWGVPMERTVAEWPGVFALGVQVPTDEGAAAVFREALEDGGPLAYDATTHRSIPPEVGRAFGVRSQMAIAIRPRIGDPWLLGVHHCGTEHIYTAQDQRILRALSHRLADALDALLALRDLRSTEQQMSIIARSEMIGTVAAGLAHDFNNKLLVILCSAELLREELAGDSGYVDQVVGAAQKAARLTQELLAFSRRAVLEPRPLDLTEAAHATAGLLRKALGTRVTLDLPDLDAPVHALVDPAQLEQVIVNLVINARDALDGGGRISIQTAEVVLAPDTPSAPPELAPRRYATLSVGDDGVGIDEAALEALFEPFFTTKARGKGTGLGLSTAHGVARQSGGTLTVRSESGVGSRFTLWLPSTDERPSTSSGSFTAVSASDGGDEHVLLVDEDEAAARVTRQVLRSRGYRVTVAHSSATALALLESSPERIDLLLTEVTLAGMDGVSLGQRAVELRPALLLTFMTGYSSSAIERLRLSGSARRLLQKPYTPDALLSHVRHLLDRRATTGVPRL
jgi:two-component system cell cycle sensor histidine kinase/response regulator CckA